MGVVKTMPPRAIALDPKAPLYSATRYLDLRHRASALSLRHYGGVFYKYQPTTSYRAIEEAFIRADLYDFTSTATVLKTVGAPFNPTAKKISDIHDAVRALCHASVSQRAPCWLDGTAGPPPLELLPCVNGVLHLPTRRLLPATPSLFALNGIDFAYDAAAPVPMHWLAFLHSILPGDADAQETLQEWFGYCLTACTHFQKMLLIVGPKRSGKGTIGRVLRRLVGDARVAAPPLTNLSEPFGMAVLIDKSVALIADARISGRADMAMLAERLLSVSGEDAQSIPRKHLPDWTGPISARFTILTNELPRIEDASGALASRFIVVLLEESFFGREDHELFNSFAQEFPGILNWALDGWARLTTRGRFQMPSSSAAVLQELEDLGSPISAFIRDCCVTGLQGLTVEKSALYDEWKSWCKTTGRDHPGTTQTFGRNLRAALPLLRDAPRLSGGPRHERYAGIGLQSQTTQPATF